MVEKSAGAVIFHRTSDNQIQYLLLKHQLGHWDFAKGHMEEGETSQKTAKREIQEETGIERIRLISDFKHRMRYTYKWEGEMRFKTVYFFIGEVDTKKIRISPEHSAYKWVLYNKALDMCKFNNQKELLEKVNTFLGAMKDS